MIDVLSTLQGVLQEAGYATRLTSVDGSSILSFEDEALMGFACVFEEPDALLTQWKTWETAVLRRYAPTLRSAEEKAWNVYSVFLCSRRGDSVQERAARWIEEDLERTRKIAALGVATREDLHRALLPLLPLRHQPVLRAEDATERLRTRIRDIAPAAEAVALNEDVSPDEVVRLLGGVR